MNPLHTSMEAFLTWDFLSRDFYSKVPLSLLQTEWLERITSKRLYDVLLTISLLIILLYAIPSREEKVKAPYVGYSSVWEPTVLLRLRFFRGAQSIVDDGYRKVSLLNTYEAGK